MSWVENATVTSRRAPVRILLGCCCKLPTNQRKAVSWMGLSSCPRAAKLLLASNKSRFRELDWLFESWSIRLLWATTKSNVLLRFCERSNARIFRGRGLRPAYQLLLGCCEQGRVRCDRDFVLWTKLSTLSVSKNRERRTDCILIVFLSKTIIIYCILHFCYFFMSDLTIHNSISIVMRFYVAFKSRNRVGDTNSWFPSFRW